MITHVRFPLVRPVIPVPQAWAHHLQPAYDARRFSNWGPVVTEFERRVEERFGAGRKAVAVSSCTAGLTAVVQALGVEGVVAVPSFTFAATAQAVSVAGCTPLLFDCDPETAALDVSSLATSSFANDLAAIVVVRPFGMAIDIRELEEFADARGIPIVVDAAAGLGGPATVGSAGSITEVFSLHATKSFGIGEGGLVLGSPDVDERVRRAANFGLADATPHVSGMNAKMSEFQAAVALAVLERYDEVLVAKRRLAEMYVERLSTHPAIDKLWEPGLAPWSMVPVLLRHGLTGDRVVKAAGSVGLELRAYYSPLHRSPQFSHLTGSRMSGTDDIADRIVCLPAYSEVQTHEVAEIVALFETAIDTA